MVAVPEPRMVAVALAMPADFVSVPLRVTSDQKNTALAYEESREALEMISQKARENGKFRASAGVVSLSQHKSAQWTNNEHESADTHVPPEPGDWLLIMKTGK